MWLQLKSGPEDSRSGWLSINLGALVAVFVVMILDVVAVVLLSSWLVVVPVAELQMKVLEDFTNHKEWGVG